MYMTHVASQRVLLTDNTSFFDNIDRLAQPDYVPTEQDVLRSRNKTEGMLETWFSMGSLRIQ